MADTKINFGHPANADALKQPGADAKAGLSDAEAKQRLTQYRPNALEEKWECALAVFRSAAASASRTRPGTSDDADGRVHATGDRGSRMPQGVPPLERRRTPQDIMPGITSEAMNLLRAPGGGGQAGDDAQGDRR